MARKRKDLGHEADTVIATRSAQGWTSESIVKELKSKGIEVSRRTVDDRRAGAAPKPTSVPLPETPEDVPDDADPTTYDYWLGVARKQALAAEVDKNLPGIANMVRMANTLLEAKRKAAPLPKLDPNENPDMVRLGAETMARLHKMIDLVTEEA